MFGTEVGVIEFLGFLEHVFTESAVVQAGSGDRRCVMETTGLDRFCELNGVAGAINIRHTLRRSISGHVVNRGEVEEV